MSHARFNLTQNSGAHLGYSRLVRWLAIRFAETFQFSLGGRLTREDLSIQLTEPGAEVVLDGLYLVDGKRHVDHSTTVLNT